MQFARKFIAWDWKQVNGRYTKTPVRVYASATQERDSFRFHVNALEDWKKFLEEMHCVGDLVVWEEYVPYTAVDAEFVVKEGWVARDYQIPIIEYLSAPAPISKIAELATGSGKGLCSMMAISNIGKRVVGIVKGMYSEKWEKELIEVFSDFKEEVMYVKGNKQLLALLDRAREGTLDCKIILISSSTLRNWITTYEEIGEEILDQGSACTPYNLFEHLGAGVRLIDECHQDFHFYFKLDTYTNVPTSISLTATLINADPFITNMYKVMFPLNYRLAKLPIDKYIQAHAVHFSFKNPERIKTMDYGSSSYSHTCLEKSIIGHIPTLLNYFRLTEYVIEEGYIKGWKKGDKGIVFAATIDLCTRMTEWFKKKYPQLDVRRYVEDDPYENIIEADLRFTTIGSGGTAIDIPGLTFNWMTTAIASWQANRQCWGRLRKRDDGRTKFYYAVGDNLDKHVVYHLAKREMLQTAAKSFQDVYTGIEV